MRKDLFLVTSDLVFLDDMFDSDGRMMRPSVSQIGESSMFPHYYLVLDFKKSASSRAWTQRRILEFTTLADIRVYLRDQWPQYMSKRELSLELY